MSITKKKPQPVYRVYAHYQDGSIEYWQSAYPDAKSGRKAIRAYLKNVWSGDPITLVHPDGREELVNWKA